MFADIKTENGRPAGYGTVRFKHPDDAVKAIGILCMSCRTLVWQYLFRFICLSNGITVALDRLSNHC